MTASRQRWNLVLAAAVAVACMGALLPTSAAAAQTRERRADITIRKNAEFDSAHGVRSGSGTATDPYVIAGWNVSNITIKDTSAHVLITDTTVTSRLILDWIGPGVDVHGNTVNDLRVNQNVPRTGEPTSGSIAHNTFGIVGQLRHFDGVFERNLVGTPQEGVNRLIGGILTTRAVNFDGFNGARFRDNIIYGYVEVRLHGHHHSSSFDDTSHDHSGMDGMDHTVRYHEVWVTGNTITVPAGTHTALQYVDTNHAGNDRTATSETNPDLNKPHVHYTRVHLTDNKLVGSGLNVDIFNAQDSKHLSTGRGRLDIENNTISVETSPAMYWTPPGISVREARDVDVYIRGNSISGPHEHSPVADVFVSSGIDLSNLDQATVRVYDNRVGHVEYGIYGSQFTNTVDWFVDGLATDEVRQPVYTSGVANPHKDRSHDPEGGGGGDPGGGGDHDHGGG